MLFRSAETMPNDKLRITDNPAYPRARRNSTPLVEGALRAGENAHPPLNMHRAFIFQGALVTSVVAFVYLLEGKQTRRNLDEEKREEADRALGLESRGHRQREATRVDVQEVHELQSQTEVGSTPEERERRMSPIEVDLENGKELESLGGEDVGELRR